MSSVPAGLLAVRKAAVLTHWVPNINLLVCQTDWPGILVSTAPWEIGDGFWLSVDPCSFRQEVCALPDVPGATVGPNLGAEGTALQIEVVTSGSTRFDAAGLFTLPFDDHHSAVGFPALASVAIDAAESSDVNEPPTCVWDVNGQPQLQQSVDLELGVKLISCYYPTEDETRARLAREAVLDAMFAAGADEVASLAASL